MSGTVGMVADFFVGGGTTGVVALKLGRRFVGCDGAPPAAQAIQRRITAEWMAQELPPESHQ